MSAIRFGRGQPLIALVAVLGGWIGGRAATWAPPAIVPQAEAVQTPAPQPQAPGQAETEFFVDGRGGPQSVPGQSAAGDPAMGGYGPAGYGAGGYLPAGYAPVAYAQGYAPGHAFMPAGVPTGRMGVATLLSSAELADPMLVQPRSGVGSASGPTLGKGLTQILGGGGLNALARIFRLPGSTREEFGSGGGSQRFFAPEAGTVAPVRHPAAVAAVPVGTPAPPTTSLRRWSADAWALLRRDGSDAHLSAGALPASYGASQAGAVLRYRLSLTNAHRPTLYMRTTSSMGQVRQASAALGVSARPLGAIPVVAAVEGRLSDQAGVRVVQPVAMAVTELPPFRLPAGMRGEVYMQGGYVAGSYATPFVDGQMRIDHALWSRGNIETRLGGGIWGGAQQGAARFDMGPSLSLAMPLTRGVFGRVAVDWRFRMAGDARPGSGPALTLSAGF